MQIGVVVRMGKQGDPYNYYYGSPWYGQVRVCDAAMRGATATTDTSETTARFACFGL